MLQGFAVRIRTRAPATSQMFYATQNTASRVIFIYRVNIEKVVLASIV